MLIYALKRVAALVITLFIILSINFIIIRLMPFEIVGDGMMQQVRINMMRRYNLDKPIIDQYFIYIKNFLSFDFGESITLYPSRDVFTILKPKIPLTLLLNIMSMVIAIPVGLACGIAAALKKNTLVDHGVTFMVVLFVSVPSFVFASLMQYFLAFKMGWFPVTLAMDQTITLNRIHSIILPILALSFSGIATITRYMRAELFESLSSDYMLLSKAKGLTQIQSTVRHAMRNSLIPVCTVILPMFMNLLGGTMVVENIFAIPGMGTLTVLAISTSDFYLISAILFVYSLISLIAVLIMDLIYGLIDPRIRIGGGKEHG